MGIDVRPTLEWIAASSTAESTLVQIGANDHSPNDRSKDPAIAAISSGWSALLLEPQPHVFARLATRYRGHAKVRTVNAAVCADGMAPARKSAGTSCTS